MYNKMKKLVYSCISLLLIASLAACSEDELAEEATTGIYVSLNDFRQEVTTRTVPSELEKPLAEKFNLKIVNNTTEERAYEGAFLVDRLIPVDEGDYTVTASYGKKDQMGLDAPAYEGSTHASVKLHKKTEVAITCSVANALMSVNLVNESLFKEAYTSFEIGIKTNKGKIGIPSSNLKKSAYFPAGAAIQIYFEGKVKGSGEIISKELKHSSIPASCKAGQHIKLTLKSSNFFPEIHKVEVRQEEIKTVIPVEWLPKPRVEAETGFTDQNITFAETESKDAKVKLFTASPLEELRLNCVFEDDAHVKYNKEYLLSNPSDKEQLEALGIILPKLGDTNNAHIDFKGLVANLQTNGAGTTTVTEITIDAKANKRWSSENGAANRTFTFTCNKPVFTPSVSDATIWTKQFSFEELTDGQVTAGTANKLKGNLTYQIKGPGEDWRTVETTGDRVCSGLTHNTTYQVRALYRGAVPSNEISVKTYEEFKLPNGDMEEWHHTEEKVGLIVKNIKLFRFYPYNKNELKEKIWWATNMERAIHYDPAFIYEITTNANVSYVNDGRNGRAAEIRTSGHGGGYASIGNIHYDDGAFAGRLFIGKYSWNKKKGVEEQTLGHAYASRPTALAFYYKYTPYKQDAFKVIVQLKNKAGEIIAEKIHTSKDYNSSGDAEYIRQEIELNYKEKVSDYKPASIYVDFFSSKKESFKWNESYARMDFTYMDGTKKDCYVGSRLKIDDIELVYGK